MPNTNHLQKFRQKIFVFYPGKLRPALSVLL